MLRMSNFHLVLMIVKNCNMTKVSKGYMKLKPILKAMEQVKEQILT